MASDKSFVTHVCDQLSLAGGITAKPMFGEYAIYCGAKMVALICDNRLFVKPTAAGKAVAGSVKEAPPYTGAKPHLLIEERLDDREWLAALVRATAQDLPEPKPKKAAAKKPR